MAKDLYSSRLRDSIANYYDYNPDTLMPLLMLALAAQGNLTVSYQEENENVFCSINLNEVMEYEWVRLDPALRKRFKQLLAEGKKSIRVTGKIEESLKDIYQTFYEYDNYTVVREYHHRIGILNHHSSNEASEKAHREYATYYLASTLLATPIEFLQRSFMSIADYMLVESGLQPERPRIEVAETLCSLLRYDRKGIVYNPFAGGGIAAAMILAGKNLYADADCNDKLFAVARLLNYGRGGDNSHVEQRNSLEWLNDMKIDYVMSTYRGYINGKTAFDFCLSKCFDSLSPNGKYAGIISPKDIFEHQSEEMKEALKRDWIETIILLPFGEVAVLVNVNKPAERKKQIRFYNLNHPFRRSTPIDTVLTEDLYAEVFKVSDVKKKDFLKKHIVRELPERKGFEIVKLGSLVSKIRKQTYNLERKAEKDRVLAYIDRTHAYDKFDNPWMNDIEKTSVNSLFAPAYHLTCDCLITDSKGELEPRLFDADRGSAYFQDGFAFCINAPIVPNRLISELNESYVKRQLHPYGFDRMLPESFTEEQILNLKIYWERSQECETEGDPDADKLPTGYVLNGQDVEYTIHKFLGHGYFGYAYSALSKNKITGEEKEVVLKEFFPYAFFKREGLVAVLEDFGALNLIQDYKQKFMEEAKIMHRLGLSRESHIVPTYDLFENEDTATVYYVMPFYQDGSLEDLQNSGYTFTEDMVIQHIVKPMCKALHVAHKEKVLHLDIKPENILMDENGDAILIDFGVAKQYDPNGNVVNPHGASSRSIFAPPELKDGNMVKFGAQADIFGLAASIFYLMACPKEPHTIMDFSDQDWDLRQSLEQANCSPQFIDAIIAGLQFSATSRPNCAQAFLNKFPGCENIKL